MKQTETRWTWSERAIGVVVLLPLACGLLMALLYAVVWFVSTPVGQVGLERDHTARIVAPLTPGSTLIVWTSYTRAVQRQRNIVVYLQIELLHDDEVLEEVECEGLAFSSEGSDPSGGAYTFTGMYGGDWSTGCSLPVPEGANTVRVRTIRWNENLTVEGLAVSLRTLPFSW